MSDLISRQAAIDAIRASTSKYTGFMEMEMYTDDDAVEAIEALPSADRPQGWVEIIRCKDCAKREHCRTSTVWAVAPNDDWYCADAERRTDERFNQQTGGD